METNMMKYSKSIRRTSCEGCLYEHTPKKYKRDRETMHIWVYDCIGTACANHKQGTPTNLSAGCSYYRSKQMDIFEL